MCLGVSYSLNLKHGNVFLHYFLDTFDDLDLLDGNSPRGGSDGSDSNGKIGGCASCCFYGYLRF